MISWGCGSQSQAHCLNVGRGWGPFICKRRLKKVVLLPKIIASRDQGNERTEAKPHVWELNQATGHFCGWTSGGGRVPGHHRHKTQLWIMGTGKPSEVWNRSMPSSDPYLKSLSLSFVFRSLIMICLRVGFFAFILFTFDSPSWVIFTSFANYGTFSTIISLDTFSPTLSLSSHFGTLII